MDGYLHRCVVLSLALAAAVSGCGYLASRNIVTGPEPRGDEILFRFHAPAARRVQLAGNWPGNNWGRGDGSVGEGNIGLMEDDNGDGVWEIRVALRPGTYTYLFWVDENTWHTDPGNPEEVEGGPVGACSRIVLHFKNNRFEIR
jgi:hypothetical protein